MSEYGNGTAMALSPSITPQAMPEGDLISHLKPAGWDAIVRFRFIPLSYLASCNIDWDPGIDRFIYLQSFIDEDES
ncbi:MAG TPA: hypothetical protein VLX58_18970 [Bryobacteraceae bacterium]|nr:hypothetical protein [Bryobacteraceae bacterium]